jgi:hypothetical protein
MQVALAVCMALAPRTESAFVVFARAYSSAVGMA